MTSGNQALLGLFLFAFMVFTANITWQSGRIFERMGREKETCTNLNLYAAGFTVIYRGGVLVDVGQ